MRGRTATPERHTIDQIDPFNVIGLDRSASIHAVMRSYERLRDVIGEERITEVHNAHYQAINIKIWDDVHVLNAELPIKVRPGTADKVKQKKALDNFTLMAKALPTIDLPAPILTNISGNFLRAAVDHTVEMPEKFRSVITYVGLKIGESNVEEKKIIVEEALVSLSSELNPKRDKDKAILEKIEYTGNTILGELGGSASAAETPSYAKAAVEKVVEHKQKLGVATMAAAILGGLLSPTAAQATDSKNQTKTVSVSDQLKPKGQTVAPPVDTSPQLSIESIAQPSRQIAAAPGVGTTPIDEAVIEVGLGPLSKSDRVAKQPIANTNNAQNNTLNIGIIPGKSAEAKQLAPITSAPEQLVIDPKTINLSQSQNTEDQRVETIKIDTSNGAVLPELNKNATDRERAVYEIAKSLGKNDILSAAHIVSEHLHTGDAVNPNANLAKHASDIEKAYIQLIAVGGHTDPNYINTTKSAIAVLRAAALNQSVLDSDEVKAMLAGVKAPDDAYLAKVYSSRNQVAIDTLASNNGVLLAGFTDPHKETIKSVYNYLLLAGISDKDIAAEVQKIKDAEAAAAAAASGNFAPGEIEAIAADPNRLTLAAIDRAAATFGWNDAKRIFMKKFVENGMPLAGASGAGGNAGPESGFRTDIKERLSDAEVDRRARQYPHLDREYLYGYGFFQWSFERHETLDKAAQAAGVPKSDAAFQAQHGIDESKSRTQRDGHGNEWEGLKAITDPAEAASYWRWNFERPNERVSHADKRVKEAIQIFNEVNGQMEAIKQEAAAAKVAREAAAAAEAARIEAERVATGRPDLAVDAGRGWTLAKNTDYSARLCDPRTVDKGTFKNESYGFVVRLCEIGFNTPGNLNDLRGPNDGGNTVASVISTNVMNMFEAARADGIELGITNSMRKTTAADYSEHKYGLAMDLGTPRGGISICFTEGGWDSQAQAVQACKNKGGTQYAAYQWLNAHAAEYGFHNLLHEPWHWSTNGK